MEKQELKQFLDRLLDLSFACNEKGHYLSYSFVPKYNTLNIFYVAGDFPVITESVINDYRSLNAPGASERLEADIKLIESHLNS